MFVSLSILSIIILFLNGLSSVELHQSKGELRRHTKVRRAYNFNHPPTEGEFIPVHVIYDDEKEIKLNSANARSTIFKSIAAVNHPPLPEKFDSVPVNDYEDVLLNPKPRSIKNVVPDDKVSEQIGSGRSFPELDINTKHKAQRRRSQVRKVKVSKSQLDLFINESKSDLNEENTVNKIGQREVKIRLDENLKKEQIKSTINQQSFKRRKGFRDPVVPIIESESYVFAHSGNYHYSYEGGDGTKAFARGEMNGGAASAVEGSFSYTDKDGNDFSLTYTADENGYRPVGAHLPTPPPIPPAIQRALDILATKTTPEPITERLTTL